MNEHLCLIWPVFLLFAVASLLVIVIEEKMKKPFDNKINRLQKILLTVFVVSLLASGGTVVYLRALSPAEKPFVNLEPNRCYYVYQAHLINHIQNGENVTLYLPLPHDQRVYSHFEFSSSLKNLEQGIVYPESERLKYSIIENDNGTPTLKLTTNYDTVYIKADYDDANNYVDPDISFSTSSDSFTGIKMENGTLSEVLLYYKSRWSISDFSMDFDLKERVLTISKEPFEVPDEISNGGYMYYSELEFFSREPAELSPGQNQLETIFNEYIMWD